MKTNDLIIIALFTALSVVFGSITLVSINYSIGLDSVPAFLALMLYRDFKCIYIASLAHLIMAFLTGFPFGVPTHIIISIGMGLAFYFGSIVAQKSLPNALIIITLINTIILPIVALYISAPGFMFAGITIIMGLLFIQVVLNIIISLIIRKLLIKARIVQ
ncbi:MAG: hypothetical protein ACRCTA_04080 [Bacilli bacterium]